MVDLEGGSDMDLAEGLVAVLEELEEGLERQHQAWKVGQEMEGGLEQTATREWKHHKI